MQKNDSRLKMQEQIQESKKRQELRENKMKELMSNDDYFLWLEKFCSKYPIFMDHSWDYNDHDITEIDLQNIGYLYLIYKGISEYAKKNYIYISDNIESPRYYKIKFNDIGYEIGVIGDINKAFYCRKVDIIDESFIDFKDIILDKKQPTTDIYSQQLNEVSNKICNLYNLGIPYKAIKSTLDNTLWQLEQKDEEKVKIKKIERFSHNQGRRYV